MKKQSFMIYPLLLVGVFVLIASSCKKEEDTTALAVLTTTEVTNITEIAAISGGNITSDGGAAITARGVCWSTSQNPTIADSKTTDGIGAGEFLSTLSALSPETTYYVRAYATNIIGTAYGSAISFSTQQEACPNCFTDIRDGNVYQIVSIGNQIWMAENLRYLPSVVSSDTGSLTIPYYYVYDYNGTSVSAAKATANYATYGVLYNWPAAMNGDLSSTSNPSGAQGICPDGWHLPSHAEWSQLTDYLGGGSLAGGKLKETGTTHWLSPNTGATNETGFTALPGGKRESDGTFYDIEYFAYWWSSTKSYTDFSRARVIGYNSSNVFSYVIDEKFGFSVRCVKD